MGLDGYDGGMGERLRILFVITDLHRGGSPLVLAAVVRGLVRRGVGVEVVSLSGKGEVGEMLEREGVSVVGLEADGARDWRVVGKLLRRLRETEPDIVCSILVHANVVAAMARGVLEKGDDGRGIRWVQSIHTVQEKPLWHWVVQGMILPRADLFVAPSRAVVEKVLRYGALADGARAEVIPNGIEVRRFFEARAIEAERRPWPAGSFVVGYVGRFDRVKRLDSLIEATAILMRRGTIPRLQLALVGYGEQEERLRKLAAERGLMGQGGERGSKWGAVVHFPGKTDEPERWYKAFDLFCSPSAAEGFGLTLVEAAVAGCPLMACETPAVRETLAGVEGVSWLPEGAAAEEVARGIAEAYGRKAAASGERVGPELAWFERRFSEEKMVDRYAGIFLKSTEGKRK